EPFYFDYDLSENGHLVHHGTAPSDYSTDVLTAKADSFIKDTKGPLFVYFAPFAPHQPTTPAPRDARSFRRLPLFDPPSYDEADGRVPLGVRYDALIHAPRTDAHLVVNIDLAPTWAALGGASTAPVDGRSFVPLLTDPNASWRSSFLVESSRLIGVPGYCEL